MTEQQNKLIRDFVLISILINDIEEPDKVPTKEVKAIYDVLKQAIKPMETIIDKAYQSKSLRSTNFIQELERKFNYNIERESKKYKK